MNIVFVSHCNFLGQSAYHVHSIVKELTARGCACVICVPDKPEAALQHVRPAVPIIGYDVAREEGIAFPDGQGPALIHCWTPREHVRRFTQMMADRYGCPYVVHLEDNEFEVLNRDLQSRGFKTMDKIDPEMEHEALSSYLIHPSRYDRFMSHAAGFTVLMDRLLEHVPDGTPGLVFWPGYDEIFSDIPIQDQSALRMKYGVPVDSFVVYYGGNFHEINRDEVQQMMLALMLAKDQGIPLWFLKTGTNDLPDILDTAVCGSFITDLGFIPRDQLPELLAIADVLIQPGRSDAFNDYRFPSKLPEALISGKPVILPRSNLGRFLVNGVDALVTETNRMDELVAKLRILYQYPERRSVIGGNGQAFARANLQWGHAAEKILTFYREQCLSNACTASGTNHFTIAADVQSSCNELSAREPENSKGPAGGMLMTHNFKSIKNLSDAGKEIQNLQYAVMERDTWITTLHQAIAEREGQIAELFTSDSSLQRTVKELDARLTDLRQAIVEREGQIAELYAINHSLQAALKERDARITDLHQVNSEREGVIAGLFDSTSSLQSVVKEQEDRITTLHQVIAMHEGRIAELLAANSSLQSDMMERDARITALHQTIAEREGVIAELFTSNSWRITQPLRIVANQMKRAQRLVRTILRDGLRKNQT